MVKSAADSTYRGRTPFDPQSEQHTYSKSYAYFLQECTRQGITAALTSTEDIVDVGECRAAWVYDRAWKRVQTPMRTHIIFNKFSLNEDAHKKAGALLISHPDKIILFHDQYTRSILDDKLKTYQAFPEYAVPTVAVRSLSPADMQVAHEKLTRLIRTQSNPRDFSSVILLKDRFGAGGMNIFKIKDANQIADIQKSSPKIQFILQPFIEASGFHFGKAARTIDLRVIIINGEIVQSYIRIAKKDEFRANAKQGGSIQYIPTKDIPDDVRTMVWSIYKRLPHARSMYALDFIKSKTGRLYFIEGNSTPGLNWFNATDEKYVKELVRLIVQEIKSLALSHTSL